MSHKMKFYPVGNGDNVLLKTQDSFTVLVDCQIRPTDKKDDGDVERFDVKADLIKELRKDANGNSILDLFINSHPHEDHCLGFNGNFYHGDPKDYGSTNRQNGEIIIGELWVTQKIFHTGLCADANAIRNEANRRLSLFKEGSSRANVEGNILHIIGYNDDDKVVDGLHYTPGKAVTTINGATRKYLSIFIHAPLKSDLQDSWAEDDENIASIIMQFSIISGNRTSYVFLAGDADHYTFKHILDTSENHGNAERLNWDIMLSPHHCSWTFFNDTPQKEHTEITSEATRFLAYANDGAHIVASSKKIEDNDDNPPHYQARKEYIKKVTEEHFKNTAINGNEKKPQPIIYEFDEDGITFRRAVLVGGATTILSGSTPRAGHGRF